MVSSDSPTIAQPQPEPDENLLQPGQVLGGWRIERLLGQGGMGSVYLALQTSLDRPVALKLLASRFSKDESFVLRFDREASALAALSHPNIISIFDKGVSGAHYYFVMEYVEGVSLRQLIEEALLDPADALKFVVPLCDALGYAHAKGIVHRDIKPENLLVARDGRIKIADFGLARLGGKHPLAALTAPQTVMGTVHYMAPEAQISTAQADARSDLYSLGVVLYEMLAGTLPLGRFDPPSRLRPMDPRLDEIVMKCLEADPAKRWQHASEIGQAVTRITTAPPVRSLQSELAEAVKEVQASPPAGVPTRREKDKPARDREPASAGVKEALIGRRRGESRRQWKARVKAMTFLGVSALGLFLLYSTLPAYLRLKVLAPTGAAVLIVVVVLGAKALRSR